MTYDTVATVSQLASLLLFIALFLAVIGYTLWPANKDRFEKAARIAIDPAKKDANKRGGS